MARAIIENWIRRSILGANIPRALHIELTTECQLSCPGCYVSKKSAHNWTTDTLSRLINEAENLGIRQFSLTGGEPLLEADMILAVAIKHSGSAFLVVTNGIAVNEELSLKIAEAGNIGVLVSHDGLNTDELRGSGVKLKAETAITCLKEAGIFAGASVRVTRETASDVMTSRFFKELALLGVELAIFAPLLPGMPGLTTLTDKERSELPDLVSTLGRQEHLRAVVPCGEGEKACAGSLVAALAADGSAMPCPHIRFSTHHWPASSLKEILDSPFFREVARPRTPVSKGRSCLVLDRAEELEKLIKCHGAEGLKG
jgi:MoaA/NifB/PqqE/SkfB family radical SAM enzyme